MKTTKTSVVSKSVLALAAVASLNAFAGPKPVAAPAPCASCDNSAISGILSADYASTLMFRGFALGDNALSTGLGVNVPLAEGFSLSLGSSVTRGLSANGARNGGQGNFQWNTYSLGLNYDLGSVKVGLVFNQYDNMNGGERGWANFSTNEVGVTASTSVGAVNVSTALFRDLQNDGWYGQASVDTAIEVTSSVKLVPSVTTGLGYRDYYSDRGNNDVGLAHVTTGLAAPIKVTKNATLTPYSTWTVTGGDRQANLHNSQLVAGVKFGVSF